MFFELSIWIWYRPTSQDIAHIWTHALHELGLSFSGNKPLVCSLHFHPDDLPTGRNGLRPDVVPSIRPPSIDQSSVVQNSYTNS